MTFLGITDRQDWPHLDCNVLSTEYDKCVLTADHLRMAKRLSLGLGLGDTIAAFRNGNWLFTACLTSSEHFPR